MTKKEYGEVLSSLPEKGWKELQKKRGFRVFYNPQQPHRIFVGKRSVRWSFSSLSNSKSLSDRELEFINFFI